MYLFLLLCFMLIFVTALPPSYLPGLLLFLSHSTVPSQLPSAGLSACPLPLTVIHSLPSTLSPGHSPSSKACCLSAHSLTGLVSSVSPLVPVLQVTSKNLAYSTFLVILPHSSCSLCVSMFFSPLVSAYPGPTHLSRKTQILPLF